MSGYRVPTISPERRRIDACLKACEGIPTDALESGDLRIALEACASKLRDLDMGWPDRELCEPHADTMNRLARLGIEVNEAPFAA